MDSPQLNHHYCTEMWATEDALNDLSQINLVGLEHWLRAQKACGADPPLDPDLVARLREALDTP